MFFLFLQKKTAITMNIGGWDYTTAPCRTGYNPVFYFVPDFTFLSYIKFNGPLNVPVRISGTETYDGVYWIRVDQQPYTDWWAGFLPMPFHGYPPELGNIALSIPSDHETEYTCGVHSCVRSGCC